MKRTVLVEGVLLLIISLVAAAEGLRLVIYKEPYTLYDPLGPGWYAVGAAMGLMVVAVLFLVRHYRNPSQEEMVPVDRKMRMRLIGTIGACIVYVSLISILGYLLATLSFFLLEFKIEGIKSWPRVAILSLVLSGLYYLVFVYYCGMVFPKGIFSI